MASKKATFTELKKSPEVADAEMTRCPRCDSTRRAPYRGTRLVQRYTGTRNGLQFTAIIRRRTACLDCGQARVDRHYLNEK